MQEKTAQEKIIHYLRVKPSTHGEVETVLLAIPNKEKVKSEISQEERKLIEETFKEQGTNLIPIIVRRIEPDEEDHEYEVVYGQKWCIIADELRIDRLWTWVFDLKDSDVPLIQEKMAALAGSQNVPNIYRKDIQRLETAIQRIENKLPTKLDVLYAFNYIETSELLEKLAFANIKGKTAQKIVNSVKEERQKRYFQSLNELEKRVIGLGSTSIFNILDSWG
ncbi:MAG: hypothetical protein RI580_17610 [Halothece sp. Uz-M2-17]|nr:hypothetical protein [Halothece sp. Uz-M2-17]